MVLINISEEKPAKIFKVFMTSLFQGFSSFWFVLGRIRNQVGKNLEMDQLFYLSRIRNTGNIILSLSLSLRTKIILNFRKYL